MIVSFLFLVIFLGVSSRHKRQQVVLLVCLSIFRCFCKFYGVAKMYRQSSFVFSLVFHKTSIRGRSDCAVQNSKDHRGTCIPALANLFFDSSVLLAGLLDGHLLLVAVGDHLVAVGSRESGHALGFSLDHSVFLETRMVAFGIEEDQIANLDGVGFGAVDDRCDRVFGGTWLVLEFPSCLPALSESGVVFGVAGHFFLLLQEGQIGHHFHKNLDRLEFGGLLCGGRKGLVDCIIGDRVEELGIRALEGQGGNPIVVNDGIHLGSEHGMEGFGADTEHC